MKTEIFKFLREYSTSPQNIDRLIVSAFLTYNNKFVHHNLFLKEYIITKNSPLAEQEKLANFLKILEKKAISFSIEDLINLFEFVVSPSDKLINGAIYTPIYIRKYVVETIFQKTTQETANIKAADISCGCGGFLLTIAEKIKNISNKSLYDIYKENIFGLDIAPYSVLRSKLLLSIYALIEKEDRELVFNLFVGNALDFDWKIKNKHIRANQGFDIIAGNPPYVASRNMDQHSRELLSNWKVTQTGHPDLYIPFFQIGYENLNKKGVLGLITVNTFIKSINGRALREYFAENKADLTIINFGGEQVFKQRNTYTCLCFITKKKSDIKYIRTNSFSLLPTKRMSFHKFAYEQLNHNDGWNLVNNQKLADYVSMIEAVGKPFKKLYTTKNGIATLMNDVYKFQPIINGDNTYTFEKEGVLYEIEKDICRDIINANKIKSKEDLETKGEKIIFPYFKQTERLLILSESQLQQKYPLALSYLKKFKKELATRDKGNKKYEKWYAFGRRQSMDIQSYKLFFPHICTKPTFVISEDRDLLFYNGLAVVSDNLQDLEVLKKILESDVFYNYIKSTTKDYSSDYISLSRNYIKNFGVLQLNEEQKETLLSIESCNSYVNNLYEEESETVKIGKS